MVKRSPAVGVLVFILLTVLLATQYFARAEPFPRKVLLLTSYHQGDRWNDSMVQGVREALGSLESVNLSIENLDLRRHNGPDHAQAIKEYLRAKYQGNLQDLVLVSDDPALNFFLAIRDNLFPNAQVVFCGINNFNPKLIQGQSNITGVNETLSLEATLELALKLFPQTTRIMAVVSDTEINGRINLEHFRTVVAQMKERVQFGELLNMTGKDAPDILSRLPQNSLVLRLINLLNPEGGYMSIQDSIRILSTHAPVPVFTAWSFDLGEGALGGYVASSQEQGRTAGNLAIRILQGQGADQIPVVMDSPNVPMFDHKVMGRFGLKESSLPRGSVILNHQVSVWQHYWGWLLGFVVIAVLQTFLIVTLLTRGKRLRVANAALRESEQSFRTLSNSGTALIWSSSTNRLCTYFNSVWLKFTGRSLEQELGSGWAEGVHPDDLQSCLDISVTAFARQEKFSKEYRLRRHDGAYRWIVDEGCPRYDSKGEFLGYIGHCLDITDRKLAEDALRESEEKYRVLLDESPDPIFALTAAGVYRYVNRAFAAGTGKPVEEITGRTMWNVFSKDEADKRFAALNQIFHTGEEKVIEVRVPRQDGDRFYLTTITPIKNVQGIVKTAICSSKDITLRKEAEDALRESEDRISSIFRSAPIGIGSVINRVLTKVNNHLCEMTGYDETYLIGQSSRMLYLSDEDFEFVGREKYAQIADHGTGMVETRWQKKDGSIIDVLLSSTPVSLQDHSRGVTFTALDITERKQAEKDLHLAHERLLAILDSIDATVYVADMDTYEILFMNQRMITDFGGNRTGDICYSAFRKNTEPCEYCTNDQLVDKQGNLAGASIWHDKNPVTGRHYINYGRAIEWSDGRVVWMQIATDITDMKRMEDHLHQAQKMESVGRLAGGVAHDFNNMLGVILGHAELALLKIGPNEPLQGNLEEIKKAAERSAELTRQLLAFARKQTVAPKVVDLNETVESALKMLRRLIGEDIDLAWLPGNNLEPIFIDSSQLDQILTNLCLNARDAIGGTGKITIATHSVSFDEAYCTGHIGFVPGEYVMLVVSDNGCGIDASMLSHIFEPFFTTKEMGKGTGLGLAMVYGAVKQNNGFINVYSKPGHGTTFKIYLPRHTVKAAARSEPAKSPAPVAGGETILLVEDETAILKMTTQLLDNMGYAVIAAGSPGEAIRFAREHQGQIDLLITDVVMPEMNGRDLARNIMSIYPDLKRLFMSGYTANVIAHHGVLDQGVHFIQKPFTMKDLGEKLREALEG